MFENSKLITGAQRVLTECLQLSDDEQLTIVHDETTQDTLGVLQQAAEKLGIPCSVYEVSVRFQRRYDPDDGIPIQLGILLDDSRAVLTCLSGDKRSMQFRRDVLTRATTGSHKRVGHMPGVNADVLATAMDLDYGSLAKSAMT